MSYIIHHYMPELGSPTAGSSTTVLNKNGLKRELDHAISFLRPGHRIEIEMEEDEDRL